MNSDVCPSCREKCDSSDLVVNRCLAVSVASFNSIRDDLAVLLSLATSTDSNTNTKSNDKINKKKDCKLSSGTLIVKRFPHYNFHGCTKDKVKKVIDDHMKNSRVKLRTDGDKDAMERRFREFIHLSNAQVDSINALTFEEVVKQVNNREIARELEAKKSIKTISKLEKLKNGEVVIVICSHKFSFF